MTLRSTPLLLAIALALSACQTGTPRTTAGIPATGMPDSTGPASRPVTGTALPGDALRTPGTGPEADAQAAPSLPPSLRSGRDIYAAFREGLAEPGCGNADPRWTRHFRHAPARLAAPDSDVLPLFGHVVDALRDAQLPTEFALIPFIESGYAPGARSSSGPAGLWQFIASTARHHGIAVDKTYDGRLSPAESTRAAIRYLDTLNTRFDGNWRLAAMGYNAGEYRILQALRRQGADAGDTAPATIAGLSPITYAYVEKLHALACLLEEAGEQPAWQAAIDRPVPRLGARTLDNARTLEQWAQANGGDVALLRRLNPALAGRWPARAAPLALIQDGLAARSTDGAGVDAVPTATADAVSATTTADRGLRTHTVRRGDSAWTIARHHGLALARLLELNGLGAKSVLRPGTVLKLD